MIFETFFFNYVLVIFVLTANVIKHEKLPFSKEKLERLILVCFVNKRSLRFCKSDLLLTAGSNTLKLDCQTLTVALAGNNWWSGFDCIRLLLSHVDIVASP